MSRGRVALKIDGKENDVDDLASRFLAARAREGTASPTVAGSERTRRLRAQGADVIDLGTGDPHLATPEHIRRAAIESIARGETHYVEGCGLPELRRAIAAKLERDNELRVDPTSEILVTTGAKAALFEAMLALVEPGVDVLVPQPSYVSYAPMVALAGGRTIPVALPAETGFRLERQLLEAAWTPRTKVIVVNSPNNPSGHVFDAAEIDALADFAQARDVVVVSDEIYEKIVYDGRRHLSVASRPGMARRTLTVNGFSKSYAMTGWRLGYLAGPRELVSALSRLHSHSATCVAPFVQRGGVAALEGPQDFLGEALAAYDQNRRALVDGLNRIRGLRCRAPEGAFYVLADARESGLPAEALAERVLAEAHVAVTPGSAFGAPAGGHLRLSYAIDPGRLGEAVERIGRSLGWR